MSALDRILLSISESAASLSSLDFSRYENFTNVVLQRGETTSLIRDVDADEQQLVAVDEKEKRAVLRNKRALGSAKDANKLNVSAASVDDGVDIDDICADLERLINIYPAAVELSDRLAYYRERARTLKDSIARNEALVDQQKHKLESLHLSSSAPYGL
ncbi:uncharacterized protein V1518DRAFT_413251 [Limtongia smithiae]|uniref:uncharacterized protein n=1 Tax=Limtongia smithiae TaxID=1125753 RepID=UPI0034CE0467